MPIIIALLLVVDRTGVMLDNGGPVACRNKDQYGTHAMHVSNYRQ